MKKKKKQKIIEGERDLLKKTLHSQQTFHGKMSTIKERNVGI